MKYIKCITFKIVFQGEDDMFYFYDATWVNSFGPFASEFEAHLNLMRYVDRFVE